MIEKCCICGKEANHVEYPREALKRDGSKSMFGISKDAVKHYCWKCYNEKYGN